MSPKSELRLTIIRKQLGVVVDWVPMKQPPKLTPSYEILLGEHKVRLQEVMSTADEILSWAMLSDLKENYDTDGRHKDDELKQVWAPLRNRLEFLRDLNPIFLAGLGNPRYAADYDYWSRMEWLKLEEALWLCVGLDPRADWETALRLNNSSSTQEHRERTYVLAVREQLKRLASTTPGGRVGFRAPNLLDWILAADFPAHPDFIDALKRIGLRQKGEAAPSPDTASKGVDRREITAMAKILTAIAIREYGYQPNSKKSPIPKEIEGICDEEGLSVSRETILKYLRIGAVNLPKGD